MIDNILYIPNLLVIISLLLWPLGAEKTYVNPLTCISIDCSLSDDKTQLGIKYIRF